MKNIYIFGAGGFGREVAWLVERINEECIKKSNEPEWNLCGFIDDNKNIIGEKCGKLEVLGDSDYLRGICEGGQENYIVCAIGNAKVRKLVVDKLSEIDGLHFATLIDPSVIMSDNIEIGKGTIICAGSILTVNIKIGCHVIINLSCTLGHDDVIEDCVTIYPSVNVSGNVHVGECVELGTGMQIIQGKKIGKDSILGAGAVVISDIEAGVTAVGCPAKIVER